MPCALLWPPEATMAWEKLPPTLYVTFLLQKGLSSLVYLRSVFKGEIAAFNRVGGRQLTNG
uniref:Uncharacterized protein n=1 Tax=uncultured marine bacterium 581 TaxID=257401 RepID=Q6SFE4_9BACT|nr:hypothetical protein MBMO_EBAC000-69B03.23 [uncultured marine bacterium 581]